METVKNIASAVIVIGGLGAFIDFLIGKTGQARAKDFMLRWWVRFDDVRWRNFGREEGLFAAQLMEKLFGRRILSLRRVISSLMILIFLIIFGYSKFLIFSDEKDAFCLGCKEPGRYMPTEMGIISDPFVNTVCSYCVSKIGWLLGSISLIFSIVAFSVSVSFTKFVTFRMADLCGSGKLRNLVIFGLMLSINYLILAFWLPITGAIKVSTTIFLSEIHLTSLSSLQTLINIEIEWLRQIFYFHVFRNFLLENIYILLTNRWPVDFFALSLLSVSPSLFRFLLSILFVSSFLLRPLVMRPVSLVWARIVESEKPVFTVMFGGAAAIATALSEVAKRL
jgi:hypothetical protein